MTFYDIFWFEEHLTQEERDTYRAYRAEKIRSLDVEYPGLTSQVAFAARYALSARGSLHRRVLSSCTPSPEAVAEGSLAQAEPFF